MRDSDLARVLGLTPADLEAARQEGRITEGPDQPVSDSSRVPELCNSAISEDTFQAAVISYARGRGWRVAHFRKARTKRGWRTAVAADGKGFPDLVMVRDGRLIFAELKARHGKPTKEQAAWLAALGELVPCCVHCKVEVHLWRPSNWPEIRGVLA